MGEPDRKGAIGKAIGVSNVPSRLLEVNLHDLDRKTSKSDLAFADGIAGLSMIIMGQTDMGIPVVRIRGLKFPLTLNARIQDVLF